MFRTSRNASPSRLPLDRPWQLCGFVGLALLGLAAFFVFCSYLFQQDASPEIAYNDERAEELKSLRRFQEPLSGKAVVNLEIDYSQGPKATWWPKGESPMLAELVQQRGLPPLAERVPLEPLVMRGAEGIGQYGGAWIEGIWSEKRFNTIDQTHSYANLVRYSPHGYPIVPHIAKAFEVNEDQTVFTFHLRKGMKWSDGHPFTADDLVYWYEAEAMDPELGGSNFSAVIDHVSGFAEMEKLDDYTIRFTFAQPNGVFLDELAGTEGRWPCNAPRHYLEKYHPSRGDQELIAKTMEALNLPSPTSLYSQLKSPDNPEIPRHWAWIYRTYSAGGPWGFVRNPYFFAVDEAGNQLPYFDKLQWELKSPELLGAAASNGVFNLQTTGLYFNNYTLLMSQRDRWNYEIRHWVPSSRSTLVLQPNLNRKIIPGQPASAIKADLLTDRRFRQALSLAINRKAIIKTAFAGVGEPSQLEPGAGSPFHSPRLKNAFIDYDPERARRLLDEIGFSRRDSDGFRAGPDGERIEFYIHTTDLIDAHAIQMVIDDWARVGVRARVRINSQRLWRTEVEGRLHDISAAESFAEFLPVTNPRLFVPAGNWSDYARGYAVWYKYGGPFGDPRAQRSGAIEPPQDHPLRRAIDLHIRARTATSTEKQVALFAEILDIAAENLWTISIATAPPYLALVDRNIGNVPELALAGNDIRTPGNLGMETFFMKRSNLSESAVDALQREILTVVPLPGMGEVDRSSHEIADTAVEIRDSGSRAGNLLLFLISGSLLLGLLLAALRHPFIARRLVIMIPTLLIISILSFVIIQLPPGDYLTTLIISLEEEGTEASEREIEEFKEIFNLDLPYYRQYLRWSGIEWFFTFKEEHRGLLQGNLGRSMATQKPVSEVVGDRIMLTFLISLGTILFTWALALPIGIYSAVRKYSPGDYAATFIGFIGMSIPNFLLAILLMYASAEFFGVNASGLFSPEFSAQPDWSWAKAVDLLKHIWVPIVVLGTGGTASMIRVMRGNLLDELNKPYVQTARAKGVRPAKLILKYPVRLALNPFISGIGSLFPQLVSGGAITAIILSLPTVGPLMLEAFRSEDMYLAGSMLMILSFLGVCGTLVSDLLLLVLDPRIRMEKGGSR